MNKCVLRFPGSVNIRFNTLKHIYEVCASYRKQHQDWSLVLPLSRALTASVDSFYCTAKYTILQGYDIKMLMSKAVLLLMRYKPRCTLRAAVNNTSPTGEIWWWLQIFMLFPGIKHSWGHRHSVRFWHVLNIDVELV